MTIKVVVDLLHVEYGALHHMKRTLVDELLILGSSRCRQMRQGVLGNIIPTLHTERLVGQRKEERERTEIIAQRQIGAQSAGHPPEVATTMGQGLFVREEVGVTLHRDAESLRQNIIPGGRSVLSTLHVTLKCIVGDGSPDVGIGLHPGFRFSDLLNIVLTVIPDRRMRIVVFALEDGHKFHLDGIAHRVSNSTLGRGGHDKPVLVL